MPAVVGPLVGRRNGFEAGSLVESSSDMLV